uniref:FAD:protein FMN transferase n=1 Tax=Rhodopseudomonas palustris (strain BisA53) TaxID=316055 RepID=Q07HT8_RHOP5
MLQIGGATMGTTWSVRCIADAARAPVLHAAIERELARVVGQMSPWEPHSDLCRFNRSPLGAWQSLPNELVRVVDCALRIARESDGAFDPALGVLVDLWGFGAAAPSTPASPDLLDAARRAGGWRALELDSGGQRLRRHAEVALDLCGIAKGFAVDRVMAALRRHGVEHALVEIGGELLGRGVKPDRTPWWVTVDLPAGLAPTSDAPLLVALHEMAIATSGCERGYPGPGRHLSHSIDAVAGAPIENAMVDASVLHNSCMEADAYATALMVLGPQAGLAFAVRQNFAAVLLFRETNDGAIVEAITPALQEMLG